MPFSSNTSTPNSNSSKERRRNVLHKTLVC